MAAAACKRNGESNAGDGVYRWHQKYQQQYRQQATYVSLSPGNIVSSVAFAQRRIGISGSNSGGKAASISASGIISGGSRQHNNRALHQAAAAAARKHQRHRHHVAA